MLTSSRLKRLHAKLPARRLFARNIEIVEQCQSTNDELKERIAAGENVSNTLLVANDQHLDADAQRAIGGREMRATIYVSA